MENSFSCTQIKTHTHSRTAVVNNFRFSFRQGIEMKSRAAAAVNGRETKTNIQNFATIV